MNSKVARFLAGIIAGLLLVGLLYIAAQIPYESIYSAYSNWVTERLVQ
jgi:archaellum component FlaF (FlaF/FlaG flagellin family)